MSLTKGTNWTCRLAASAVTLPRDFSPMNAKDIRETIDAAAAAGFDAMSFSVDHHDWAVADGVSSQSFFEYHHDRGLPILAGEVVLAWADPAVRGISEDIVHTLDVAATSGAGTVIAATIAPEIPPLDQASAWLGELCDRAADLDLGVSFEFLPWAAVPTLVSALQLLDAVDRPNLGLVIDAWHWSRQPGGPDFAALRRVAPERIHLLHLDDALPEPAEDLMAESGMARQLPGEGASGVADLIDVLADMGATPGVVSEVFSSSLRELGAHENARRQHAAARAVLRDHEARAASKSDR